MSELLAQAKPIPHQEVLWRVKADPARIALEVPGLALVKQHASLNVTGSPFFQNREDEVHRLAGIDNVIDEQYGSSLNAYSR